MDCHLELRAFHFRDSLGYDSPWHEQSRPLILLLDLKWVISSFLYSFGGILTASLVSLGRCPIRHLPLLGWNVNVWSYQARLG